MHAYDHVDSCAVPSRDTPLILSPAMCKLYDLVARAAATSLTVLILGETGSGKELVARAIHEQSARAKEPFKAVNCATIPANLIESTLFGHERGAFTGADRPSRGIFEQAQGGSVFLDEVAELSPQAQAALLRVLEQRRFVRVGSAREHAANVRVLAATHRDLPALVAAGAFREDVLFRLDALSLHVPALRERREDIVPLARLFLLRARREWGSSEARLSDGVTERLLQYDWPGNVRQLRNVIERAAAVCSGQVIEVDDLPNHLRSNQGVRALAPAALTGQEAETRASSRSLPEQVREFESAVIRDAMAKSSGSQSRAARLLGVPRRTLAYKVRAYGLLGGARNAGRAERDDR